MKLVILENCEDSGVTFGQQETHDKVQKDLGTAEEVLL